MTAPTWHEANQQYLIAHLQRIRRRLEPLEHGAPAVPEANGEEETARIAAEMNPEPSLDRLCRIFGLSSFERDVLLLAAGIELDSTFAERCAIATGTSRPYPSFSLSLSVLPEPHWSALTPTGTLRRWRLIEVGSGAAVTSAPLRIDESVLHYIAGLPHRDERLAGLVEALARPPALNDAEQTVVQRIVQAWTSLEPGQPWPMTLLAGDDVATRRAVAYAACESIDLRAELIAGATVPASATEIDAALQLWDRHAALDGTALVLEIDSATAVDPQRLSTVLRFAERVRSPLVLSAPERLTVSYRTVLAFDIAPPTPRDQRHLWIEALGPGAERLNGVLNDLAYQFQLRPAAVRAAALEALSTLAPEQRHDAELLRQALWHACREQTNTRMDELAQRIEPAATWDDLVLPQRALETLKQLAVHVRQRARVYGTWGFARKGARGLGISALFAGPSGTGKTMAAEVLAGELQLDLYRVDLSRVVSKYIGETEKNLRRIFDAAESGSAILLFDEADALFGKRSEVKDSHDRYANVEISYLLQRMECYRGLAILTTNMKNALDTAFLRRIRFVVPFPFPDEVQRTQIWERIFPTTTPTENLDRAKLARLNVSGGNIRSIAMNAAFLAAEDGTGITMHHLFRAAQTEYLKLEKPLTEAEVGGVAGWM
jgi:SpoVK/Ycf46/Vps4 family AAA+-type ATPase